MVIKGDCDLSQLSRMKYIYDPENHLYFFDGRLHRYTFQYGQGDEVIITITPRPHSGKTCPYNITFGSINSFVKKSVDRIKVRKGVW